jgi:hypothetical protein
MNTAPEILYYTHLARLLQARLNREDQLPILDTLDAIWETLSPAAIDRVNAVSAHFAVSPDSERLFLNWFRGQYLARLANVNAAESGSSEPRTDTADSSSATYSLCA